MAFATVTSKTIVKVEDLQNLLGWYRAHRKSAVLDYVGSIKVVKPLTIAQRNRLPRTLRAKIAA